MELQVDERAGATAVAGAACRRQRAVWRQRAGAAAVKQHAGGSCREEAACRKQLQN